MVGLKDATNILGGGGDDSAVWVGALGSTLPTGIADPASPMASVGLLSDDGISFSREEDRQVYRAHQGGLIVKRRTASVDDKFKFQCLETTALNYGLIYKGQVPVVVSGVGTITVANQARNDDRAWVVDEWLDNGKLMRYVVPNGSAELTGEVVWKTTDLTVYEFTVGVNGNYTVISNAAHIIA